MQICVTSSTAAGLQQILPWLYYHKVIGVSRFFLFVEGEAAKPAVSAVLESIRVSLSPFFILHRKFMCTEFGFLVKCEFYISLTGGESYFQN